MLKLRKGILFFIISLFIVLIILYNNPMTPNIHSKSAILMDASTGEVLFEKDGLESYPVASMSKLMTEYIILDLIENESIHWEDEVLISETANAVGEGAIKIPVDAGDVLTVQDLFRAMVISSANNATIALAEYVAGTEEAFTMLMNEQALQLGLSDNTQFVNATGLPSSAVDPIENMMSAHDLATLAFNLLQSHPHEVLETASVQQYYMPTHGIYLFSTNKMLSSDHKDIYFKGMDGLKTGFTNAAGYSFIGTASRNDKRLISVIMNAESDESRFVETKKLLSYGFGKYPIYALKEQVKSIMEIVKFNSR